MVVAANKVDDAPGEPAAAALWALGLGEPWPVSALHGRGSGDLLDAVLAVQWECVGAQRHVGQLIHAPPDAVDADALDVAQVVVAETLGRLAEAGGDERGAGP